MVRSHFDFAGRVLREAVRGFLRHECPRLGAALAFYTLLSLSPLLVIVLSALGYFYEEEAAYGVLAKQIEDIVGGESARAIESMVDNAAHRPQRGMIATLIGIAVLLFGASGVFVELKGAIDAVLETPILPSRGWGLRALARERILAFAAIGGLAFLLLVSLIFSAVLNAIGSRFFGHSATVTLWARIANSLVSFLLTSGMFAMIFKLLPAVRPAWRQVGAGAVITALLFLLGKSLIGLYLGRAAIGSSYGAAGSLVVLLVWVYYSTQILLFGAELTRAGPLVRLQMAGEAKTAATL